MKKHKKFMRNVIITCNTKYITCKYQNHMHSSKSRVTSHDDEILTFPHSPFRDTGQPLVTVPIPILIPLRNTATSPCS